MAFLHRSKTGKVAATALLASLLATQGLGTAVYAQPSYEIGTVTTQAGPAIAASGDPARSFVIQNPWMETSGGVKASVTVNPTQAAHTGEEVVIFELMKGTTPVGLAAVQKDFTSAEKLTAHFNSTGDNLSVKVFVVDSYSGSLTDLGTNLAEPVVITPSTQPAAPVTVQLLGINDFHGQLDYSTTTSSGQTLGGAAYLASYLKQYEAKNPNTLLVHNGDAVGASSPVSALDRDKPTMEWLDLMGFDVGTLGNHEFDQGWGALKAQLEGGVDPKNAVVTHQATKIHYVNANALDQSTGKPLIAPYYVQDIGGVKIGFIGVVTMLTPSKVSPEGLAGVSIVEQAPVVNAAVAELKKQGVKAIVVLAHDPASQDKNGNITGEAADLANAVDDEVDVVFAGDNHAKVNGTVDGKLVFQAYSYGTAFAAVNLTVDPASGDIVNKAAQIVDVNQAGQTPDPATAALVQKYLDLHPALSLPVGHTSSIISKAGAYNQENALGDLIADAMKEQTQSDFAFMNPGGIRADLPQGNILYSDLFRVQPFGNQLITMTLTGTQIKTLLQQQWGETAASTKTLQISGLKYTADFSKPIAERVVSLTKEDGTAITDTGTYKVVVNNFMAAGGDNYKVLVEGKQREARMSDIEALYNYVIQTFHNGEITASLQGRITNLNQNP